MNPSKKRSSPRTPAVAGKFYPENPVELEKKIACHLGDLSKNKRKAIGVVSPHAGLIYYGDVAGAVYSRIEIPETVILLGLNHTGQGEGIVKVLEQKGKTALIIASSDMTHFESHKVAEEKDKKAISKIENRDALSLDETVRQEQISMCGVNPVTVMLLCCEKLGAQKSELIEYKTSGDVNGDKNRVVGYAGVIVT